MDSLIERTPGVLDTETWPAPFPTPKLADWREGDGILIAFDLDAPTVELPSGAQLPLLFEALIDRPENPYCQLRIGVRPSGPVCRRLVLALRPGETELRASQARVPLDALVREAATAAGTFNPETGFPFKPEEVERGLAALAPPVVLGKRIPDEHFKAVADVYRYAARLGKPPTAGVAEAFNVSRSTAGRWVVETRRRGFLGPALPGVAGELEQEESNG